MADLSKTNIAFLGTDLEKKIKEAASKGEPAWTSINLNELGMYIWRIEKFNVVPVDEKTYGTFYEGDSYILLNIYEESNELKYNVHFWLGSNTTHDELGTAAYKTVELDNYLHGNAVQFREVQSYESDLFKSYFPQGIEYKVGGVESGFHIVSSYDYSKYKPILYMIHNNSVSQIPLIVTSLNEDDVFVLDAGLTIYVYSGHSSSHKERYVAECTAQNIQDNRKGAKIIMVKNDDEYEQMLDLVGQNVSGLEHIKLYRIAESGGIPSVESINDEITSDKFNSDDAYVLDTPMTTYIWVGKNSNYAELIKAWQVAFMVTSITDHITLVKEGREPELFLMFVTLG